MNIHPKCNFSSNFRIKGQKISDKIQLSAIIYTLAVDNFRMMMYIIITAETVKT